jgi:hypothetical protein
VAGQSLPTHHFWVTPIKFDRFAGIIGTDILSSIGAVINCSDKALQWNTGSGGVTKAPLNYVHQLTGEAEVSNLSPQIKKKMNCISKQITPIRNTILPAKHVSIVKAKFRKPVFLNQDYEIESAALHPDGVLVGRALIRPFQDGTFMVPILNLTNCPFPLKANHLLSLAFPATQGTGETAAGPS